MYVGAISKAHTLSSVNVSRKRSSSNTDVTHKGRRREREGMGKVSFFIPSSSFINQCGVEASVGDDQNVH